MVTKTNRQKQNLYGSYITSGSPPNMNWTTLTTTVGKAQTGDDNPKYREVIADKGQATNNYEVLTTKQLLVKSARFDADVLPAYHRYYGYTDIFISTLSHGINEGNFNEEQIADNTDICMGKIFKKLAQDQLSFGGLELLAEFRDTLHMIKHPAEALASYLNTKASRMLDKRLKHNRKREWIKRQKLSNKEKIRRLAREERLFNKTVASSWLELQFGAKPFVNSIIDIAQTSVDVFPSKGSTKLFTATHKSNLTEELVDLNRGSGFHKINETINNWHEYEVKIKARKTYSGEYDGMSTLQYLSRKGGFTLPQVAPLLWELTPLSVFADMFVNVGDVLQASVTETQQVTSVDIYATSKIIRRRQLEIFPLYDYTFNVKPSTREGTLITLFKKYKRKAGSLEIPSLRFSTPVDNLGQTLNLSAFLYLVNR